MTARRTPTIYIVSDGRGETCAMVVKAAAVQFEGTKYRVLRRKEVRTVKKVLEIVRKASEAGAIIFYTLVGEETRAAMESETKKLLVPTVDLLGPAFSALRDLFKKVPGSTPGLLVESDRQYYRRLDAIDYTIHHDDGMRPHELSDADVVLVGVSRASKTTTSFLLGYRGIRAANVPLVPGIDPPAQLLRLDPSRVIGLRINVMRLRTVREARAVAFKMSLKSDYVNKRAISREVLEANALMERCGWRSIDVSYLAVEEIARQVMQLTGLKAG